MRINLARWDRFSRLFFGVLLAIYMVIGGPFWSYLGIYFIITGSWGFCPIYVLFNIRTHRFARSKAQP